MSNRFLVLPALVVLLIGCNAETAVKRSTATPLSTLTRDGTLTAPGRPQIAALPATAVPGPQVLRWNMWWGETGRHWQVQVNGHAAAAGDLAPQARRQQQGSLALRFDAPGRYEIRMALCNDHGCTPSDPVRLDVVAG